MNQLTQTIDRFNAYFRSANGVPPNDRISVPTAEWVALRSLLVEALSVQAAPQAVQAAVPSLAELEAELAAVKAAPAAQAVEPEFFTVFASHNGGKIALPGYSNETEKGVKDLVLHAARQEGYKGTVSGRLLELGWWIGPVFASPPEAAAPAPAAMADEGEMFEAWARTHEDAHGAFDDGSARAGWQARAALAAAQGLDAATLDALQEAESVLNSINMGKQHKVVQADGDVTYWQREEWCKWAKDEVLPKVTVALAAQAKQAEAIETANNGGCGCCANACADRADGCRFVHEAPSAADMKGGQ